MTRIARTLAIALAATCLSAPLAGQTDAASGADGMDLYREHCASCHGQTLSDGQFAPSLKSKAFAGRWAGAPDALDAYIASAMPPDEGGSLPADEYRAITAYVLRANGIAETKPGP